MRGRVCVITLNRPKALNALCDQLLNELAVALDAASADQDCGCVVITGGGGGVVLLHMLLFVIISLAPHCPHLPALPQPHIVQWVGQLVEPLRFSTPQPVTDDCMGFEF